MFNKKPRRNFRQRKDCSSDDEDQPKKSEEGEENPEKTAPAVVNKPRKAAQSRGITCSSKREATPPKPDTSDGEDGESVETTEEREERKKDKEGTKKKETSVLSFSDDKESEESTFKLKKSSEKAVLFQIKKKEAPPAKTIISTGSDERGVGSPSASSASDSSSSAYTPVNIPNAREIEAAKRRRRANRTQKEFIPLSRDGQSSAGSTPDHYSREDEDDRVDDDNELDDHERRIEFAPRMRSIRERIAEKLGMRGRDTEKIEQELWEETQIGKGVKRRPGEQRPINITFIHGAFITPYCQNMQHTFPPIVHLTPPLCNIFFLPRLESLKEVYRARQAELRRMEGDVEGAKTSLENLEESSSEKQLKFYRTMTTYVHNMVECLQEKVVEINSLELELHTLLSDQMEALLAQRREKIKEQADHLQQLSCDEVSVGGKTEEDFDMPEDTQPSAEEEEQLQKKIADILLRSKAVFSDVQEDFCNVKKILSRFEEWRECYSESYHNAYISLCLPKLLNPIIRHQLLAWNPLKDTSGDFENLPWFTAVETFCHGHGHEELEHTDRQTLSSVIERTVVPKMTAYVELVWDPMSHQQSVCLTDVCHSLKEDYSIFEGEHTKPVKAFTEALVRRLRSCVDEDVFIPLYPKKFLEEASSPQRHFRDQQFWTAVKLLGNMGKWDLLLPESVLKELMLDKLLNRYLMTTLCSQTLSNNAVYACKKIADGLPPSWFEGESTCLPQLQNFRNHIVQKVHAICKQQPPKDPNTRSAVVDLLKVLSAIRCHDSIMAIAEKYHYEDAIYSHQLLNPETA
uniref:GC-rich sequence DNA-binding factor 2 n=1 Tax=Oreochromis niloticus TaxID=8128 RepID=I3KKD9_ORENI